MRLCVRIDATNGAAYPLAGADQQLEALWT
jgi:hypothetical protein